ncbi:hypothetical protein HDU86_001685 [Geranomyces michiganensis]|nr:hypothetical protein HDU86_001685 [Geranomyces michiganensis]
MKRQADKHAQERKRLDEINFLKDGEVKNTRKSLEQFRSANQKLEEDLVSSKLQHAQDTAKLESDFKQEISRLRDQIRFLENDRQELSSFAINSQRPGSTATISPAKRKRKAETWPDAENDQYVEPAQPHMAAHVPAVISVDVATETYESLDKRLLPEWKGKQTINSIQFAQIFVSETDILDYIAILKWRGSARSVNAYSVDTGKA